MLGSNTCHSGGSHFVELGIRVACLILSRMDGDANAAKSVGSVAFDSPNSISRAWAAVIMRNGATTSSGGLVMPEHVMFSWKDPLSTLCNACSELWLR